MKLAGSCLLAMAAVKAAADCSVATIKQFLPSDATIFYAQWVAANETFTPPPALNTGSLGTAAYPLPRAGCVIQANISLPNATQHSVAFVLPDDWNGRFMVVGDGGFAGSISWSTVIDVTYYGFASASSDLGHESSGAQWAYRNPSALADWGYIAMHDVTVNGKAVTTGYYGSNISYSYYRGCSAGGKQGLKEVEMFPDDFDGVIAGAPAWWTTHLQLWNMINGIWNYPNTSSHYIPESMFSWLAGEVVKQCDPQDGVKDGVIMDPEACVFRPEALLCANNATNTSTCLNADQIVTFNKLHHDWYEANQTYVFGHLELGSEWLWHQLVPAPSDLGTTYVQYMLDLGPDWTYEDWNPSIIQLSDQINPGNATAGDFDIEPFQKKGGKLLHYHGWADWSIATGSSLYFYEHVYQTLAPRGINLDDFYRFFLVPGMGHCSGTSDLMAAPWYFAGDGQSSNLGTDDSIHGVPGFEDAKHDIVLAMMDWVEKGIAPDEIIGTRYLNESDPTEVYRQRPLCPYPKKAVYNGTGDVDKSESWYCKSLY